MNNSIPLSTPVVLITLKEYNELLEHKNMTFTKKILHRTLNGGQVHDAFIHESEAIEKLGMRISELESMNRQGIFMKK